MRRLASGAGGANAPKMRPNQQISWEEPGMKLKRLLAGAAVLAAATMALSTGVSAQTGEIKIGSSMAMTGGLGPNGKSALLAWKIWEEDVNAKGGLLG